MTSSKKKATVSDETKRRIEEGLRNWEDSNSVARRRFAAAHNRLEVVFQPIEDAIAESECLTQDDLAIRINTRD